MLDTNISMYCHTCNDFKDFYIVEGTFKSRHEDDDDYGCIFEEAEYTCADCGSRYYGTETFHRRVEDDTWQED